MPITQQRTVMIWLYSFAAFVAFLVVFGGFVRLTRSGLSIVEWNPVSGALPPIGAQAWEEEFAKYQQTPEFKIINPQMTLAEYRYIFYIEWIHRFLARLAGLAYAVPVFYFLIKKIIPFREFGIYLVIGSLFIGQAFMGWYMVASGLVDRPAVSHFRLTIHLLFALALLGLSLWVALGHQYGFRPVRWKDINREEAKNAKKFNNSPRPLPPGGQPRRITLIVAAVALIILVIQITYGGMTAGLKAGHVSDTWPLMFGRLIPEGMFDRAIDLLESPPQTIVFIHRWFAWLGLIVMPVLYWLARRAGTPRELLNGLLLLNGLVAVQIFLGVWTVLFHVPIAIALLHQANALALFALGVFFLHRLRA